MATRQEHQGKPPSARKYENYVEQQLARASGRVRSLDLVAAALVFLIGTLTYGLAVILADLWLELSSVVRLLVFVAYTVAAVIYAGVVCARFFRRRVNPYYAARQLEKTLPDAKGSVVNWLDLRGVSLPGAIRSALGARAAKDLSRADLEEAVSTRQTLWLTGTAGVLLLGVLGLFLAGPNRFPSLLARAFAPFKEMAIPTRTVLTLLQPQDGHATVPVNQPVTFRVQVQGRVPRVNQPDALKLNYRYNPADPYIEQPLEQDADGDWTTTVPADQVQNGFWYNVSGGDAETPAYQVKVRSLPQVARFDVRYHYRPYHRQPDRLDHYPNERAVFPHLKDYQGTEVTLLVKTNRTLREGRLEMELGGVKQDLPGKVVADDRETLRFQFVLEKSGTFRVHFTSQQGEMNTDRSPYPIDVLSDTDPLVELHKPGKDVELPANGTLQLEGSATDDLGITRMTLRMKVAKGGTLPELQAKAYREGKSFQLASGKYPDRLEYKDFVALDQLKTARGTAFPLTEGMELEYWLEAVDNSNHPKPGGNVGQSKHYKVTIREAEKDKQKQTQERQQAQQKQQEHEKKQDEEQARKNDEAAAEQQQKSQGEQPKQDFEKKLDDVKKALEGEKKGQNGEGQSKNTESASDKSAAKPKGSEQAGSAKDQGQQPPPQGAGPKKEQDQANDAGQAGKGAAKEGGREQPRAQAKGDDKSGNAGQESKSAARENAQQPPGAGKDEGKNAQQAQAGKAKAGGDDKQARTEPKQGGESGTEKASGKDDHKEPGASNAGQQAQGERKDGPGSEPGQPKAQEKSGQQAGNAPAKGAEPTDAKGDKQPGQKNAGNAGKEPTLDDVARLKEELRRAEQPAREQAREELSRLHKEAKDPKVRNAAGDALQQAKGEPGQARDDKASADKSAQGDKKDQGVPEKSDNTAGAGKKADQQSKEDNGKGQGAKGPVEKVTKGESKGGPEGTLGQRPEPIPEESPRGTPGDPAFAKRAGELQLEELKNKLTPDVLKKLNWSDKDREQFLKDARAYEEMLRRQKAPDKEKLSGSGLSKLPSTGPRQVGPGGKALSGPLDVGPALLPPEFRDAHRRFTSSPEATRSK